MKKYLILLIFIFISCKKKIDCGGQINLSNIIIRIEKSSPILREYDRYLVIICNEEDVSGIKIKGDIGTGARSYLYDDGKFFTLIDCDSSWYVIDKDNGTITLKGNFWMKDPPKNYMGTFILNSKKNKVEFIKENDIQLKDIYIYGGG